MISVECLFEQIESKGYDAFQTDIEKLVCSDDEIIRAEIAQNLCFYVNAHAEKQLIKLLNDSSTAVVLEATDSLSSFKSDNAYEALKSKCAYKNYLIRGYALFGVGCTASNKQKNETILLLFDLLKTEKNTFVKICILSALYMLGEYEQLHRLFKMFRKCSYRNKCAILNTISDLLIDGYVAHFADIKSFVSAIDIHNESLSVASSLQNLLNLISTAE